MAAGPGRSPAGQSRQFDAKNEVHGGAETSVDRLRDEMAMALASLYLQSPVPRDSSGGRCKDRLHTIT